MIVENNKYFNKYQKYKRKYKLLKYNQVGGKDIDNINNIKKLYESIPDSGLYNKELSSEERIKQFKKFCDYLYDKTKNNDDIIRLKRKILLERKKLTDTNEYKLLVQSISDKGKEYKKIGDDFEKKCFVQLLPIVTNVLDLKKANIQILQNPVLYLENKNQDKWETIGEIDAIIIEKKEDINYIIGICEMKQNFDDIPDALFQIKRSFNILKNKNNNNVKLNDIILNDNYKLKEDSTYLNIGFIFTSYLDQDYFNIQSKIRHYLINNIHLYGKIKYNKIFKKILNKQKYVDKLTGKTTLRYSTDVLSTIKIFEDKKLENHIQLL